jgi:hypothetical protein
MAQLGTGWGLLRYIKEVPAFSFATNRVVAPPAHAKLLDAWATRETTTQRCPISPKIRRHRGDIA